jgi:hypothetical protein
VLPFIKPDMSNVPILSAVISMGASSAGGFELVRIESNGSHNAVLKTEMNKKKAVWPLF